MKRLEFEDGLEAIYAAFGKNMPANAAVIECIWQRIAHLPDEFMQFAKSRLQDMEKLPANLGLYIARDLWSDFKAEHPEKFIRAQNAGCGKCHNGLRMLYSPDGGQYATACGCCTDRKLIESCGQLDDYGIQRLGLSDTRPQVSSLNSEEAGIMHRAISAANEPPRKEHLACLCEQAEETDGEWL